MQAAPPHSGDLNWNNGKIWTLSVHHIVVYAYPFPLVRTAQPQGRGLGAWWIRSGKADVELDGEKITLSKGDMVFFTPEMKLHGEHNPQDPIELIGIRFYFLNEHGAPFFPGPDRLPCGHYKYMPTHSFDTAVLQLLRTWRHAEAPQTIILHSIGLQLIGIAHSHSRFREQAPPPEHPKYKGKISRVVDLVQDQYDRNWTAQELAEEVGLHPSYLTKLFRRITGSSLKQYIVQTRIQAAQSYLSETNTPIGEIAEMCGYKDPYFFSRHFKKIRGMAPSEYRQEMTGKDPAREQLDRMDRSSNDQRP